MNDAVVIEPSQDVVHLVFNGSAYEQRLYIILARSHRLVVGYIVESVQQEDTFEHGKVRSALMFYTQTVRIEALCDSTELGYVVIEFRDYVVPEIVRSDGLPIHEIVFIVEESLDRLILAQELKNTS